MIRMSGEQPKLSPLEQFISETFPESVLKEEHHNMLHYHFTSKRLPLSFIFGTLESVRVRFGIEDYSVCQTTLDQVCIMFWHLKKTNLSNSKNIIHNKNLSFLNKQQEADKCKYLAANIVFSKLKSHFSYVFYRFDFKRIWIAIPVWL